MIINLTRDFNKTYINNHEGGLQVDYTIQPKLNFGAAKVVTARTGPLTRLPPEWSTSQALARGITRVVATSASPSIRKNRGNYLYT